MCTEVSIKAKDGSVVVARTMDFAKPTGQKFKEFTNHKYKFKAKLTDISFLKWSLLECVSDGFNEKGLSIATLWLPETEYAVKVEDKEDKLSALSLPQDILGNCANVDEAVAMLKGKQVSLPANFIQQFATIHLSLIDKTGKAVVVEFKEMDGKKGVPIFYKNETGVLTNAPSYPWHLENLRNWVQISPYNTTKGIINGFKLGTTGFGNNQSGLPASATPVDRFVRVNILKNLAINHLQPKNTEEAMLLLDKLISKVEVIKGTSANHKLGNNDEVNSICGADYDYTQWTVIKDLTKYRLYQKSDSDLGYAELK
ncbi:linear amide C-N hydrolase [Francisella tularensis]|uniref:linear amide C-N hydrolase n=1 Tax=Francisella tularensis TaxID=263 RepID=UPI0008F55321|nr:linear amide C-N hydrolase [Francisella tularensis]APA83217.1 hypothetical protein N894_1233 [Francisella tularensis subsp. novicida PA10-7858]